MIVGLGKTGLSVAHFLARRGESFVLADSRMQPHGLADVQARYPHVPIYLGPFDKKLFARQARIVLSPGVSLDEPAVRAAQQAGVEVLGDIELFARYVDAPVVGITGSNGKSTVTTLLAEMALAAGLEVRVGGNLGTPALELLLESDDAGSPDLYVLELSSFQLETVSTLECKFATVLNLSVDHMDRHGAMADYIACKQRVFHGVGVQVLNADDELVAAMAESGREIRWFALSVPDDDKNYGLADCDGRTYLCCGAEQIIAVDELKIAGRHNWANVLAALALADALSMPRQAALAALREFKGLPHRCQWLARINGVDWFDDSKGTNVGSTVAALAGMPGNKVVLIAGGDGKGQDFSPLHKAVSDYARAVVLIGRDAALLDQAIDGAAPVVYAGYSLVQAVQESAKLAQPGDTVLLSPACASFDMFTDYVHRAEVFKAAVQEVAA